MSWYHVTGASATPEQWYGQDADSPASATDGAVASDGVTGTPRR